MGGINKCFTLCVILPVVAERFAESGIGCVQDIFKGHVLEYVT